MANNFPSLIIKILKTFLDGGLLIMLVYILGFNGRNDKSLLWILKIGP